MQTKLWCELCIENQVSGLVGCVYEQETSHCFYHGNDKNGRPMNADTVFNVGGLGYWVKAMAAVRCCLFHHIDLTVPLPETQETLLTLMHTNELVFESEIERLTNMDMKTILHTFLTRPLYLTRTRLEQGAFITNPISYMHIVRTLLAGLWGRSRFVTHAMIGALFTPTPLPGFSCNDSGCFGFIDSGPDFAAGFLIDMERQRALVLMSDNPTAASTIETVFKSEEKSQKKFI